MSYGVPLQHCDGDWQMISGKVGAMIIDTIIHETIGQYTGLTDKNGVKIFEGDIIRYTIKEHFGIYGVCWNAESACFAVYGSGLGEKTLIGDFTFFDPQKCKVLSNVHDTPAC